MADISKAKPVPPARLKSSPLVDTRVIYCGDNPLNGIGIPHE
jgi:hypothetical protein